MKTTIEAVLFIRMHKGKPVHMVTDATVWTNKTDIIIDQEFEFTVEVPELDQQALYKKAIDTLEQKKLDLLGRHYQEVRELEKDIEALKCLPYFNSQGVGDFIDSEDSLF
jgi:hypothetical protein